MAALTETENRKGGITRSMLRAEAPYILWTTLHIKLPTGGRLRTETKERSWCTPYMPVDLPRFYEKPPPSAVGREKSGPFPVLFSFPCPSPAVIGPVYRKHQGSRHIGGRQSADHFPLFASLP